MPKFKTNLIIKNIENFVIATILMDKNSILTVLSSLEPKHFTSEENCYIYSKIKEMDKNKIKIDHLILAQIILNDPDAPFKNPDVFIKDIMKQYTTTVDLDSYIDLMFSNYMIDSLNDFSEKLLLLEIDDSNFSNLIWNIQNEFLQIVQNRSTSSILDMKTISENYIEKLKQIRGNKNKLTGTSSGFFEIDNITNGFQNGDLIILAARPSIGKTALALNFLLNASKELEPNETTVMFSLEMGSNQLMQRLLSNYSEIPSSKLANGTWNEAEEFIMYSAAKEIGELNIKIDDDSNPTILDIQSRLQKIHNDKKIKLIIVDYLQLIAGSSKIGSNRQQEVSQISRTLKSIARTYDCPLIAIAQLSRKIEERKGEDKKPMLSDLRESGSIEQDADLVTFLNHDVDNVSDDIIPVNFYIAKHRNGAVGNVKLLFKKDIGKFVSIKNRSN